MLEYKGVLYIAVVLSWCRGSEKVVWRRWSSLDRNENGQALSERRWRWSSEEHQQV